MTSRGRIKIVTFAALTLIAVAQRGGGAPNQSDPTPPRPETAQEVEVIAAYLDPAVEAPVVVLRGKRDKRVFPMTVGPAELTAIAVPLNGVKPVRPLTHDLFVTLFGRLKVTLTRVVITDLRNDIYYATVHLTGAGGEMTLDARPSDAIALALRAKVPVLVEDRVFEKAGRLPAPAPPQT
jgi:hypothetical protein